MGLDKSELGRTRFSDNNQIKKAKEASITNGGGESGGGFATAGDVRDGKCKEASKVKAIIGNSFPFKSLKLELPELQGEPEDISKEKARVAALQEVKRNIQCFNLLDMTKQMAKEEKNKISHSYKSLAMLKSHFKEGGYVFQTTGGDTI